MRLADLNLLLRKLREFTKAALKIKIKNNKINKKRVKEERE